MNCLGVRKGLNFIVSMIKGVGIQFRCAGVYFILMLRDWVPLGRASFLRFGGMLQNARVSYLAIEFLKLQALRQFIFASC